MNRRTVDTRLSSAPTHLIKQEPGNEASVSLAPWTCARPRAELSNGHDSIIRELKSTASKSLVASLSESAGQNYKHIAIQKLQIILTLESPIP